MTKFPAKYQYLLKFLIGIGLLVWLISRINLYALYDLFRQGDFVYLVTGLLVLLFAFGGLQTLRLHWAIKSLSGSPLNSLKLFFVGFLFNNLLPTNIGGDAVRMYYLQQAEPKSWGKAGGMLFIHRMSGLLTLFLGGFVYTIFNFSRVEGAVREHLAYDVNSIIILLILIVLGFTASGVLFFNKKLQYKLIQFFREAAETFQIFSFLDYLLIVILAAAFHLTRMIGFFYLIQFLGASIHLVDLVFVLFATALISLIPVSFGGLGLMEGAITSSLMLFGIPPEVGGGVALINRMVLLVIAGIGAIIYGFSPITYAR